MNDPSIYLSQEVMIKIARSRRTRHFNESNSDYDDPILESATRILAQLRQLDANQVLMVGELPPRALAYWEHRSQASVVITDNRREHYLANHAELIEHELNIILALLAPDEIHSNAIDPEMAIIYKRLNQRFSIRIALLVSHLEIRHHSVISARLARTRELEHGRKRGRMRWER